MKWFVPLFALVIALAGPADAAMRQQEPIHAGGEASLVLPDLATASFFGYNARTLLMGGIVICIFGLLFGLV